MVTGEDIKNAHEDATIAPLSLSSSSNENINEVGHFRKTLGMCVEFLRVVN